MLLSRGGKTENPESGPVESSNKHSDSVVNADDHMVFVNRVLCITPSLSAVTIIKLKLLNPLVSSAVFENTDEEDDDVVVPPPLLFQLAGNVNT